MIIDSLSVFILNGRAGHGKDYVADKIKSKINKNIVNIFFAESIKNIMSKYLPRKFLIDGMSNLESLNYMKDNDFETEIIKGMNTRFFFQVLLGDTIRTINPAIHSLFVLKKIERELMRNPDTIFICTDNRYKNEQRFLLSLNLVKKEDRLNFVRFEISRNKTTDTDAEICNTFKNYMLDKISCSEDIQYVKNIMNAFILENRELSETIEAEKTFSIDYDFSNIQKLSSSEGVKIGLINIFRPLIPENINSLVNIENVVSEFHGFSLKDSETFLKRYTLFDIELTIINIHKYGFIRANPNHEGERDLENRKPHPFINSPKNDVVDEIMRFLN